MKAEIKQQWLAKLRSGQVTQAKSVLRNADGGMCCLGVLLDVVAPNQWGPLVREPDTEIKCHSHPMATADGDFINSHNRSLHGLTRPTFDAERAYDTTVGHYLADMNDQGKSFAEIADWIEANIPAESTSTGASES